MAISYTESAWNINTADWTITQVVTGCQVNDRLVAFVIAENIGTGASWGLWATADTAGTTGDWTVVKAGGVAGSDCYVMAGWADVTGAGDVTVQGHDLGTQVASDRRGIGIFRIPAAEVHAGTPTLSVLANYVASGLISQTIAVGKSATVLYGGGDWTAATFDATTTPAGGTVDENTPIPGAYTPFVAHWTNQGEGTRDYGPGVSGTRVVMVAYKEEAASGGTSSVSATRGIVWDTQANVSYVGAGAFASGTGALTVALPAGATTGDLLLLAVESANEAISVTTAGWTEVITQVGTGTAAAAGGVRAALFWKWYVAGSVAVADSGNHTTARIVAFRNVDPDNPFANSASRVDAAGTTTLTTPSIMVPTGGMGVHVVALDLDAATTNTEVNAVTGATLIGSNTVTSGVGGGLGLLYATTAGTQAFTQTGGFDTSLVHAYISAALNPLYLTVAASRSTTWNVQGSNPISTTRSISWTTRAYTPATTRQILWNTLQTLTPLSTTRALSWVTRAYTPTSRALVWSSAAYTGTTRGMLWTTLGTVPPTSRMMVWTTLEKTPTSTRDLLWTTREKVPVATREALWTTLGIVPPASREMLWTVAGQATATGSMLWATREWTGTDRVLLWAVDANGVASASRVLLWETSAYLSTDRVVTWTTLEQAPVTSRSMTWITLGLVAASRSTTWNSSGPLVALATTRGLLWQVAAYSATSRAMTWTTLATVPSATRGLVWNIAARTMFQKAVIWSVSAHLTTSREALWTALERVQETRTLTWHTLAPLHAERVLVWQVAGQMLSVATTRVLLWSVVGRVLASRDLLWTTLAQTSATRDVRWTTLSERATSRVLLWAVRTSAGTTRDMTWQVAARTGTDRVVGWDVAEQVQSSRGMDWDTLALLATSRLLRWTTRKSIDSERVLRWDDAALVGDSRQAVWTVLALLVASRLMRWNVLFGLFIPDKCRYLYIVREDRVLSIPPDPRELYIPAEARELVIRCP